MNQYIFFISFIPLIIALILIYKNDIKTKLNIIRIKRKKRNGRDIMSQIIEKFIGKQCLIYTMDGSAINGTITEMADGWLNIDNGKINQAINLDYITKISEQKEKRRK